MCSLAVMSIFSGNILSAQAAVCKHEHFLMNTGGFVSEYHDDTSHYEVRGTQWVCAACGYSYWDDGSFYTVKTGDHIFDSTGICECGYKK